MGKWKFINIFILLATFVFMVQMLHTEYQVEPVAYLYILCGITVCVGLLLIFYYPLIADSKIIKRVKDLLGR